MEGTPKKIFNTIAIAGAVTGVLIVIFGQLILPHFKTNCDSNYSPCVPNVSYDLNCPEIGHQVTVKGVDKYRLDRDGDGVGCETYGSGGLFWSVIIFGALGAFVGGWIGLFVAMGYESYEGNKKKNQHHDGSNST